MDFKLLLVKIVYLILMVVFVNKYIITLIESINVFIRSFNKEFKLYYEDKGIIKQIIMSVPLVLYLIGIVNFKENIKLVLLSISFVMILELINNNKFIGYKEVLSSKAFSSMRIDYGFKRLVDGRFCVTGILVFTTVCGKRKYTNCFAENIESLRNIFHKINSSENVDIIYIYDNKLFFNFYDAFLELIKTINKDKNVILQNKFKFKRLYENIIDDGRFNELFEEFQKINNK